MLLRGLPVAQYPFVAAKAPFLASDMMDSNASAEAVAICFVAGSSQFYRFAALANRAIFMLKSGQHKRLLNALRWRSSVLVDRLSAKVMGRA